MQRVAVVAPEDRVRSILVTVAEAGVIQIEREEERARGPAGDALVRAGRQTQDPRSSPLLDPEFHDIADLERQGAFNLLAGEAELESARAAAVQHGSVVALVGWSPRFAINSLANHLASLGGALVALPMPRGVTPPTLITSRGATKAFQPLVDTYATLDYRDLNPSLIAGLAYIVMFGMMFGDVGHGVLLLLAGLVLGTGHPAAWKRLSGLAPFVVGAGIASVVFGFAYGEAFGPTGLVPTVWLAPLSHPTTLLAVAVALGAGLLAVSYALGTVNRWREGGATRALVATSGLAGAGMYVGLALGGAGVYWHAGLVEGAGGVLALIGLGLGFLGLYAEAGGRASGVIQATIELFDVVVRIGTNAVSFARLAAFGLTHAALCMIVWDATSALWHKGSVFAFLAVLVFLLGNAVTFSLEGLVAGVQAMRLDYYELFSRIFTAEGLRFCPWYVPTVSSKETSCSPG
jgi:V/A-type H+-transporting ATPase subunit I